MVQIIDRLLENNYFTNILLSILSIALVSLILIYIISFFQGREISFWPMKIGPRNEKVKAEGSGKQEHIGQPIGTALIFENYRTVNWDEILCNSQMIDIAVTFFASWAKAHWESLLDFYRRGGRIRLIQPDPKNDVSVNEAWKYFPRYKKEEFVERIENTVKNFESALQNSKAAGGVFEAYYFQSALNYAIIRVDNKKLFFSFYEHGKRTRIGAQSFLINLEESPILQEYWTEEFETLFKGSIKIDPRQYG